VGIALCLLGFSGAALLTRRRLGEGVGFVLLVGCLYGWLRCWFYNPATHFMFDATLLGFYLSAFARQRRFHAEGGALLQNWTLLLVFLPLLVLLAGPLVDGQPFLVQLVGLRSVLLFVPAILVAAWLSDDDVAILSDWALLCVFVATAFAIGELAFGVSEFFPVNAASRNIFSAADAGPDSEIRIPASFNSSHSYGGTMVTLIPLLLLRLERRRRFSWLTWIGLGGAACGAFICSARIPVLLLAALVVVWTLASKRKRTLVVPVILGCVAVSALVLSNQRFRRYETLGDTDTVGTRIASSANRGLIDIVIENPLGKGLASAVGTSIPYFLSEMARPQEGLESEFSRLALELGLAGLLAWASFVTWCLVRDFRHFRRFGGVVDALMWALCVGAWSTGVVGAGVLSAVPGTFLLMIQMTLVASQRSVDERIRSPILNRSPASVAR